MAKPVKLAIPDFEHSLPMMLLRAREAVMGHFRPMLRKFDLTEQQWRIIRALSEVEERDASDLAAVSYILAPSLTRILKNLESRRIVRRRTDKKDQRRALISLTKNGRDLLEKVQPYSRESYEGIATSLGPNQLSELYDILGKVERTLKHSQSAK